MTNTKMGNMEFFNQSYDRTPAASAFLRFWRNSHVEFYDGSASPANSEFQKLSDMVIGIPEDRESEETRCWLVIDWMIRKYIPDWLRAVDLPWEADQFSSFSQFGHTEDVKHYWEEIKSLARKVHSKRSVLKSNKGETVETRETFYAFQRSMWDAAWYVAGVQYLDLSHRRVLRDIMCDVRVLIDNFFFFDSILDVVWDCLNSAAYLVEKMSKVKGQLRDCPPELMTIDWNLKGTVVF